MPNMCADSFSSLVLFLTSFHRKWWLYFSFMISHSLFQCFFSTHSAFRHSSTLIFKDIVFLSYIRCHKWNTYNSWPYLLTRSAYFSRNIYGNPIIDISTEITEPFEYFQIYSLCMIGRTWQIFSVVFDISALDYRSWYYDCGGCSQERYFWFWSFLVSMLPLMSLAT